MKKRFKAPVLLLLSVLLLAAAAGGLCAETPWGRVRIVGYKDSVPSDGRKFAPRAVLQDVPYAKNLDLHLEYRYQRFDSDTRCWQVNVIDGSGANVFCPKALNVIFPYPSIWSERDQAYWKWTRRYAERYSWYYSRGYADLWYASSEFIRATAGRFKGEDFRAVQPEDPFGIVVPMGRGLRHKSVLIRFAGSGLSGSAGDSTFDRREDAEKEKTPFDELFQN